MLAKILDLVTFLFFFLGLIVGGASSFFLAKHLYLTELDTAKQNAAEAEAEALRLTSELGRLRAEYLSIAKLAKEREARIESLTLTLQAESAKLEVERRRSAELARETTHLQERLAVAQAQVERFGQWASRYPPSPMGGELTLIGGAPQGQNRPDLLVPAMNQVTMATTVGIALLALFSGAAMGAFLAGRRTGSRRR